MAQGPGDGRRDLRRRLTIRRLSTYSIFTIVVIAALIILNIAVVAAAGGLGRAFTQHYYVAVGDSLSFSYQPTLDFNHGFAEDLLADFKKMEISPVERVNTTQLLNYACAGERTDTLIQGNCPLANFRKVPYSGAQLDAVIQFLNDHRGKISPVTFEIGANDVLPDWRSGSCTAASTTDADIARMDDNLTRVAPNSPTKIDITNAQNGILARLTQALTVDSSGRVGDLVMLNYYNPFAKQCPNSAEFVKRMNDHLAADAKQFGIPIVDVYTAFGGDSHMADNICTLSWYCSDAFNHDIHPTTAGYAVIAAAVKATLAYPGVNPGPKLAPDTQPLGDLSGALIAWRRDGSQG